MSVLKKRTFFEINEKLIQFFNRIEDAGGEITDGQEIELNKLQLDQSEKMASVACVSKEIDMDIKKLKEMKEEISKSIKTHTNNLKRLKTWFVKRSMEAGVVRGNRNDGFEADKINNSQVSISWRKSKRIEFDEQTGLDTFKSFPQFFKFLVIPKDAQSAKAMLQMIEKGYLELRSKELSRSTVDKYFKNGGAKIVGIESVNYINPVFKI